MSRQHGTRARYAFGPAEDGTEGQPCRCEPCTEANRAAESHRTRMIAYGQWKPFVDAGAPREHVRMLMAHGIGFKQVAKLAGVSNGAISRLLYGGPGERPPTRRLRPETAAALLAVQAAPSAMAASAPVDGTGTGRRLRALVAAGWSQTKLANRLGIQPQNLIRHAMRGERVTAATAKAVAVLYDELWNQPPPEATHRDKIAASRARNMAAGRGWVPPLAWDDDEIDDPAAAPADGWRRTARSGRGAELADEVRDLARHGYTTAQAAERLGVGDTAARKAIERYGRPA